MKTGTAVCQQLDSNGREDMDEFDLPGFRFHPTEQELVGFYLKNMVQGKHINLNVIGILDLYRYDPWELPNDVAGLGRAEERELFFFVPRDKNGSGRTNRIAISGYWKTAGSDKQIVDRHVKCIGVRKTLVFYKGRAPRGQRTDWVMKEYRMPDDHKSKVEAVVCCVYRKATPRKWVEQRALNHVEDQPSGDDDDHDLDCTNKPHETRLSSPEVMDRKLENTGIARSELCTASSFQSAARRETKQISVSTELQIAPDLCQLSAKAEGDCVAHTEASSSTPANNSNIYGDLMIDPAFQAFVEDGECEAFSVCGRDNNLSFMDLLESSSDCSCLQDHPFPASLMDGESHIENQFQQSPGLSIGFFFNEATLYSRLSMAEKYPLNGLWTPPATFEYSCFDQEYMQNNNGSIEL